MRPSLKTLERVARRSKTIGLLSKLRPAITTAQHADRFKAPKPSTNTCSTISRFSATSSVAVTPRTSGSECIRSLGGSSSPAI